MQPQRFQLVTTWRVKGEVGDVYEILNKPEDFVRWWPSVYLEVKELKPGDAEGVGRIVSLRTRGKLPYTLNWQARAIEKDRPSRLVVEASGDLQGRGEWRLVQAGDWVQIHYHWTVVVTRRWMNILAPLLRPVFAANHRWAMRRGEEGLKQELADRGDVNANRR